MHHLGLDFGTTTSILSYQNNQHIESFKLGGAAATPYIPSVLSIDKTDNSLQIGKAALLNQGDEDYQVFRYFKMLLAEKNPDKLKALAYLDKKPETIALQYIQELLNLYRKERGIKQAIHGLVITVPEIWVREGNHAAREALNNICSKLGLKVKLLSEPVAASVYFVHRFKAEYKRDFNGHVLVCDYGGGTLDFSLSAVAGNQITVLEGTGKGSAKETVGIAGVAFDEAVVKRVLTGQNIVEKAFYRLLREFEEHKIIHTERLEKTLGRYRKNPNTNKKVFEIGDYLVTAKDLVVIFDELIEPVLNKALMEMSEYLKIHQVDTSKGERFRVVMVGGFSNFCLVRHCVKAFFNSKTDADTRFHSCFDLTETALAISKGAALIANERFKIEMACPISVGLCAKNTYLEQEDILILKKGTPLTHYQNPQFNQSWLEVLSNSTLQSSSLIIFLDVGNGKRRYINLKGQLQSLIPNPHINNKWQIGFSVDENLFFKLHVKDKTGADKVTALGNLEDKMGGLHISES